MRAVWVVEERVKAHGPKGSWSLWMIYADRNIAQEVCDEARAHHNGMMFRVVKYVPAPAKKRAKGGAS